MWHRSFDVAPPNGESIADVQKRVDAFLDEIEPTVKDNETIFISAHGNSIRPMSIAFEGLTPEQAASYEYTPGEIFYYSNEEEPVVNPYPIPKPPIPTPQPSEVNS